MSDDIHEVYAVRYAHHGGRSAALNFIGGDPHQAEGTLDLLAFHVREGCEALAKGVPRRVAVGVRCPAKLRQRF